MDMIPQFVAIAGVLGALFLAVWALKRKGWARISRPASSLDRPLEVVDRLVLTPHHSLHLVRMADRTLLIGLSPNGCNLLESAQAAGGGPNRERNLGEAAAASESVVRDFLQSSSMHPGTIAGSGR
jgi:flagellar biogenesis protein FliO